MRSLAPLLSLSLALLSPAAGAPPPLPAPAVLDARGFGCKGDGVADDRVALDAAVKEAIASRRPLFLPAGVYLRNSSVPFGAPGAYIDVTGDLVVLGAGRDLTRIKTNDAPRAGYGYELFRVRDNAHLTLRDLELAGPASVDASTNPNVAPQKGQNSSAPTYGVRVLDCTRDGSVRLERVDVTGLWFQALQVDAGAGFGRFDMTLLDSTINAYGGGVGFFSPLNRTAPPFAADRSLICRNVTFTAAGIPPGENAGANFGHTIYAHPDTSILLDGCRFDVARFYAIHLHSGTGKTQQPRYQLVNDCDFSPGVLGGMLLSETGLTEFVGGHYDGTGPILCNAEARFVRMAFDPSTPSFAVTAGAGFRPVARFIGCPFGRNFRAACNAGDWLFFYCDSLQGGPLPGVDSGPLASRPAATAPPAGGLYWATDELRMYRRNGTAWAPYTVGNAPVWNAGANVTVQGGHYRGAPGPDAVNSVVKHQSGSTTLRGLRFSGRFGGGVAWPVQVMPGATGSLSAIGCVLDLAAGAATNAGPLAPQAAGLTLSGDLFAAPPSR